MDARHVRLAFLLVGLSACAAGVPTLEYGMPSPDNVRYAFADTTTVGVSMMGQTMEIGQRATAEYAVAFSPAPAGVNVTMSLSDLSGEITQPMGAPLRVDESAVEGVLVFSLDRHGNAVVAETPEVELTASQMVSGLSLAHSFFPGLPAASVVPGDSWVDTVTYEGEEGPGDRSESAVVRYTVVGDTVVAGRPLLRLDLEGTSSSTAEVAVAGMTVRQASELQTEGYVLWDPQAGLMVERYTEATGRGSAAVPVAPDPIPIRIRTRRHVRLLGG